MFNSPFTFHFIISGLMVAWMALGHFTFPMAKVIQVNGKMVEWMDRVFINMLVEEVMLVKEKNNISTAYLVLTNCTL